VPAALAKDTKLHTERETFMEAFPQCPGMWRRECHGTGARLEVEQVGDRLVKGPPPCTTMLPCRVSDSYHSCFEATLELKPRPVYEVLHTPRL
jgi:hypothetical protein